MRKKIIESTPDEPQPGPADWLDLERVARVELTSESEEHPIEAALVAGDGWRAGGPGEQLVRLAFDRPLDLRRIRLAFRENARPRTQEFVLRWRREGEEATREIVRQQFHFAPPDTTDEIEEYRVELEAVASLEIEIVPDISGGDAPATLAEFRIA
jgi:hypothetical protein